MHVLPRETGQTGSGLRIMGAVFLPIGVGTRKSSKGGGRESRYVGANPAAN